jgi:hypothetical protein
MAQAVIIDDQRNKLSLINEIEYSNISIAENQKKYIAISEILPFRIRITNIGIEGFSSKNPAPIGIAIIGINNYIL